MPWKLLTSRGNADAWMGSRTEVLIKQGQISGLELVLKTLENP